MDFINSEIDHEDEKYAELKNSHQYGKPKVVVVGPSGKIRLRKAAKKITNFRVIKKATVIYNEVDMQETLVRLKGEEETTEKDIQKSLEIYQEVEWELKEIMPLLRVASTSTLIPFESVYKLKTMRYSPILPVKIVLEGICVLKGILPWEKYNEKGELIEEDWWIPSKKIIGNLVPQLVELKRSIIPLENLKLFERKFTANPNFKEQDKIFAAYPPALAVYEWMISLIHYQFILRLVKDKKRVLNKSKDKYLSSRDAQISIRRQMAKIEERLKIESLKKQENAK